MHNPLTDINKKIPKDLKDIKQPNDELVHYDVKENQTIDFIRTVTSSANSAITATQGLVGSINSGKKRAIDEQTQGFIEKYGQGGLGERLLQPVQSPQGLALPEGFEGLQLPPVEMKQLSIQFENSGSMFVNAVDRLIQTMESTDFKQQPTIINLSAPITVTAKSESALAQKTGESVLDVLEKLTDKAISLNRK